MKAAPVLPCQCWILLALPMSVAALAEDATRAGALRTVPQIEAAYADFNDA